MEYTEATSSVVCDNTSETFYLLPSRHNQQDSIVGGKYWYGRLGNYIFGLSSANVC